MASFNIHLSIAKRYIEKNNIDNKDDFYKGCLAPDLSEDDDKSHYSRHKDKKNILEYLKNKVDLNEYLKDNEINTDYDRGVFLHLITDHIFYNEFFDKNYLLNTTYKNYCKDLYYSYGITNKYLEEKYNIDIILYLYQKEITTNIQKDCDEKKINMDDGNNILPIDKLNDFIERVSDINLEDYKTKITKERRIYMNEELIDVLDENGIFTGEVLSRREIHQRGLWHRAIIVAIVNEQNKVLVQKRSSKKEKNAGMWDISVAGHISAGQDSLSAAAREINEEVSVLLGYRTEIKDFRYMYSFRKEQKFSDEFIERQFYDFFILRTSGLDDKTLYFQESEVEEVRFVDLTELQKMIEEHKLVERSEIYQVLFKFLFRF